MSLTLDGDVAVAEIDHFTDFLLELENSPGPEPVVFPEDGLVVDLPPLPEITGADLRYPKGTVFYLELSQAAQVLDTLDASLYPEGSTWDEVDATGAVSVISKPWSEGVEQISLGYFRCEEVGDGTISLVTYDASGMLRFRADVECVGAFDPTGIVLTEFHDTVDLPFELIEQGALSALVAGAGVFTGLDQVGLILDDDRSGDVTQGDLLIFPPVMPVADGDTYLAIDEFAPWIVYSLDEGTLPPFTNNDPLVIGEVPGSPGDPFEIVDGVIITPLGSAPVDGSPEVEFMPFGP